MRSVTSRFSRPARTLAALGFLTSGVLMLLAPAGAQTDESTGSYAKLSKDGWWERKPSVPNVPANAIAVAADRGEPSKVAAIGLDMFVADTEEFAGLTLTLKESAQPGSSFPPITEQGQAQPQTRISVVACPITSIWTPADGGDINAGYPTADCEMARGDGVRKADGTWTFDLAMLAELWMADTIQQNGVLLIERSPSPVTFQVSYDDLSTGTPMLTLETTPIEDETEEEEDLQEEFEDFVDTGTDDADEDENFFDAVGDSVTGTTDTPFGITDTPPTTAPPAVAERVSEPVANRRPTKGSLPLGTLALIPIALGLALLFGVVLGPAGDPATARRREGGLSRALAQRATTTQQ